MQKQDIDRLVTALEEIGFGDAANANPKFGAIEQMTVRLCDKLGAIEEELSQMRETMDVFRSTANSLAEISVTLENISKNGVG